MQSVNCLHGNASSLISFENTTREPHEAKRNSIMDLFDRIPDRPEFSDNYPYTWSQATNGRVSSNCQFVNQLRQSFSISTADGAKCNGDVVNGQSSHDFAVDVNVNSLQTLRPRVKGYSKHHSAPIIYNQKDSLIDFTDPVEPNVLMEFDPLCVEDTVNNQPACSSQHISIELKPPDVGRPGPLFISNPSACSTLKESTSVADQKTVNRRSWKHDDNTALSALKIIPKKLDAVAQLEQLAESCLSCNTLLVDHKFTSTVPNRFWSQRYFISQRTSVPFTIADTVMVVVHEDSTCRTFKHPFKIDIDIKDLLVFVCHSESFEHRLKNTFEEDRFALRIWGRTDILVDGKLKDYAYVHEMMKLDRHAEFALFEDHFDNIDHEIRKITTVLDVSALFLSVVPNVIDVCSAEELLSKISEKCKRVMNYDLDADAIDVCSVIQLVKQLCAASSQLETTELFYSIEALNEITIEIESDRCKFRDLKSTRGIVGSLSLLSASVSNYSPKIEHKARLKKALNSVTTAVAGLFNLLSNSNKLDYTVSVSNETPAVRKSQFAEQQTSQLSQTDLISLSNELSIHIDSVYNIPLLWKSAYECFYLKCCIYYGTTEICPPVNCRFSTDAASGRFYSSIRFQEWVHFKLPICALPREANLCLTLVGCKLDIAKTQTQQSATVGESDNVWIQCELGWSSISLISNNCLRQGDYLLEFLHDSSLETWIINNTSFLRKNSRSTHAIIKFTNFYQEVVFPSVIKSSPRQSQSYASCSVPAGVLDIFKNKPLSSSLDEDEKELLWNYRSSLTPYPNALPLILSSVPGGWAWANLNSVSTVIDMWPPLSPEVALELLLPVFPDVDVRNKAVKWLSDASLDTLIMYLPQLTEALRFEVSEQSELSKLLLSTAEKSVKFGHNLYWQLNLHASFNSAFGIRCKLLQKLLLTLMNKQHADLLEQEDKLLCSLSRIASAVKQNSHKNRKSIEASLYSDLKHLRDSLPGVSVPLLPEFGKCELDVFACSYYHSFNAPLKLVFKNAETVYGVLYKVGDDLRQDSLVMQMVSIMERVWLAEGIDLRLLTFKCLPTDSRSGLIELVPNCSTLREIYVEISGSLSSIWRDDVLYNWLQKHNPDALSYQIAMNNFRKSCAAWCVATYVLGIGDRHNDNILLTTSGHFFHIDFGKYLGDVQMFKSIRRDRVPFVLTPDMVYVINDGAETRSYFQEFVDNCCIAFNVLRRRFSVFHNLLRLMLYSGIPGLTVESIQYISDYMWLDVSETEASAKFTRLIEDSVSSRSPLVNNIIHSVAQMKVNSNSGAAVFSFMPSNCDCSLDGRLECVRVVDFIKITSPEKHYMFKICVERQNEAAESYLYRTYKEFTELYEKLMTRFCLAKLPALGREYTVRLTKEVALRQREEITKFLIALFNLTDEVAHCDLVKIFFHPLLRDQQEKFSHDSNFKRTSFTGQISLELKYDESCLRVFVKHANLSSVDGAPPVSYVKLYLRPDHQRLSKKKTRLSQQSNNPTFNQEFKYEIARQDLTFYTLEVTCWHRKFGRNEPLGVATISLTDLLNEPTIVSWFPLDPPTR